MGKINLAPLRVKRRALADLAAQRMRTPPIWLDIVTNNPPAQVWTRKQPQPQDMARIRTKQLGNGKTEQYVISQSKRGSGKPSRLFAPLPIQYEEDELRQQFFQDHPWELARPRTLLETSGNQHQHSDWSTGLKQPFVPVSGESVVQRQLWLMQNVPDMTKDQAYDLARREFYIIRRQEQIAARIAKEEAEHMGAQMERGPNEWSVAIEDKQYLTWEQWASSQVLEQAQKNAAFSGAIGTTGEQKILANPTSRAADPFAVQDAAEERVIRN